MGGIMLPMKRKLSLDAARQIMAAAESEATKLHLINVAIIIVDDGGYLVHGVRMDRALPSSADIGLAKARAAALLGRPTKFWRELLNGGALWPLGMPYMVSAEGGLPLIVDGEVVGGIGVSGASGQDDRAVADAGVAALGLTGTEIEQSGKP
jgi:glc operon protein GlcG